MGLRVFADGDGSLYLQITAPELNLSRAIFLPAMLDFAERNPAEFVRVTFRERIYSVPFLSVMSRVKDEHGWKHLGELEQTDSINVLNHLVDVLAYPNPNPAG